MVQEENNREEEEKERTNPSALFCSAFSSSSSSSFTSPFAPSSPTKKRSQFLCSYTAGPLPLPFSLSLSLLCLSVTLLSPLSFSFLSLSLVSSTCLFRRPLPLLPPSRCRACDCSSPLAPSGAAPSRVSPSLSADVVVRPRRRSSSQRSDREPLLLQSPNTNRVRRVFVLSLPLGLPLVSSRVAERAADRVRRDALRSVRPCDFPFQRTYAETLAYPLLFSFFSLCFTCREG